MFRAFTFQSLAFFACRALLLLRFAFGCGARLFFQPLAFTRGAGLFLGDAFALGFFLGGLFAGDACFLVGFALGGGAGFVFQALPFTLGFARGARLLLGRALAFGFFPGGLFAGDARFLVGFALGGGVGFVFQALLFTLGFAFSAGLFLGDALALSFFFGSLLTGDARLLVGFALGGGACFLLAALLFAFGFAFNAGLFLGDTFARGFFFCGLFARGAGAFLGLALGGGFRLPFNAGQFLGGAHAGGFRFAGGAFGLALRFGGSFAFGLCARPLLRGGTLFFHFVDQRAVELHRRIFERAAAGNAHTFELERAQGRRHHG